MVSASGRRKFVVLLGSVLWSIVAGAQPPEMTRLANALAGDWQSVEVVQYGKPVPAGQGRRGASHVRLAGGGTALVDDGHTLGVVGGELTWFETIWWDPAVRGYRFLTCFKASDANGCELRGTAQWVGDTFVNEYEELVDGKPTKMRDVWSDITPKSHTLTEFHDMGNGDFRPYVVSHVVKMP